MPDLSPEAGELILHIDNTQAHGRHRDAACAALARHVRRGDYAADKAPLAFRHVVDAAAKSYAKEYGGVWHALFSPATRDEVAASYAAWFDSCLRDNLPEALGPEAAAILAKPAPRSPALQP